MYWEYSRGGKGREFSVVGDINGNGEECCFCAAMAMRPGIHERGSPKGENSIQDLGICFSRTKILIMSPLRGFVLKKNLPFHSGYNSTAIFPSLDPRFLHMVVNSI